MKFLLNVYTTPVAPATQREPERAITLDQADFVAATRASGELVDGQVIADPSNSMVVRVRESGITVVDGTYVRSPVQLASYYLVDCEDHNRALELAVTMPAARYHGVEVRPVMLAAGMEM